MHDIHGMNLTDGSLAESGSSAKDSRGVTSKVHGKPSGESSSCGSRSNSRNGKC